MFTYLNRKTRLVKLFMDTQCARDLNYDHCLTELAGINLINEVC